MSSHITLIRHSSSENANIGHKYFKKFNSYHEIWTSRPPGDHIIEINQAFEFSGYQEGLEHILKYIESCEFEKNHKSHTIVFLNDTMFSGHIKLLTRFVLNSFLCLSKQTSSSEARLTGLMTSSDTTIALVAPNTGFFSTWIFMLEGSLSELRKVKFYDPNVVFVDFIDNYYNCLPLPYRRSVDEWLQPTRLLSGWYKSVPGRHLAQSTLDRKRFTIYLEHTLPHRLHENSFQVVCLSQRLRPTKKILLALLRFMDRCYINFLKLYVRLWTKLF